jgi:hypothetical protein
MRTQNTQYLLYAQKKILRRLGVLAGHRKDSSDIERGRDLFGTDVTSDSERYAVLFLQYVLMYIKEWGTEYGTDPRGKPSGYCKLYAKLQDDKVEFPNLDAGSEPDL